MTQTDTKDSIVKEIVIHAPAEKVFEALADPRQRVKWWGAEGKFQATEMESDLRAGGAWVMRGNSAGNRLFTITGKYLAVERPRLLEMTWVADWHDKEPATVVRFDLIEKDGSTTVRLTHSGFASEQLKQGYQGWPWLLVLLQKYVESGNAKF